MKPKSKPEIVELDAEELEAKLDEIEQALGEATARPFRQLLGWYLSLLRLIEQKNTSIRRLRRLLQGPRTERSRDVESTAGKDADSTNEPADQAAAGGAARDTALPPDG